MLDTFSAHSLKVLDKSLQEFKNKFEDNCTLYKKDKRALLGQKFHSLICSYIKGYDVSKLVDEDTSAFFKIEEKLRDVRKNFIKTEHPFLIKEKLQDKYYYLTGRFDAIYKDDENYIIYDWKTLNLPKYADDDLQSVVYLYCGAKIFSKNIKMRYFSVEKLDFIDINYKSEEIYKNRIDEIVQKYLLFSNQ